MKLIIPFLALGLSICAANESIKLQNISQIQQEYSRLLPLFQQERKQFASSSKTHDYWKGKHGKAIIHLGPVIIPQLIKEVEKGDFFFNVPLAMITKVQIADQSKVYSEQQISKLWIKWWQRKTK